MTEEEMREKIVSLENENKDLLDKYNTVSEQIKVKDDEITSLNSKVSDLKQKNYDLFIQIPNSSNNEETQTQTQKSSITNERTTSIADVVSNLLGGNRLCCLRP